MGRTQFLVRAMLHWLGLKELIGAQQASVVSELGVSSTRVVRETRDLAALRERYLAFALGTSNQSESVLAHIAELVRFVVSVFG